MIKICRHRSITETLKESARDDHSIATSIVVYPPLSQECRPLINEISF